MVSFNSATLCRRSATVSLTFHPVGEVEFAGFLLLFSMLICCLLCFRLWLDFLYFFYFSHVFCSIDILVLSFKLDIEVELIVRGASLSFSLAN